MSEFTNVRFPACEAAWPPGTREQTAVCEVDDLGVTQRSGGRGQFVEVVW